MKKSAVIVMMLMLLMLCASSGFAFNSPTSNDLGRSLFSTSNEIPYIKNRATLAFVLKPLAPGLSTAAFCSATLKLTLPNGIIVETIPGTTIIAPGAILPVSGQASKGLAHGNFTKNADGTGTLEIFVVMDSGLFLYPTTEQKYKRFLIVSLLAQPGMPAVTTRSIRILNPTKQIVTSAMMSLYYPNISGSTLSYATDILEGFYIHTP